MRSLLILGGTGFVGRVLCERLVDEVDGAGCRLTVPTRRLQHGKSLLTLPTIRLVEADVHDEAQLRQLVAGHEAVINLVAILHGSAAEFERVHVALPRRLAEACRSGGVRRLLHVSALGVAADAPSKYLRSKAAGEAALRGQGLDVTVLRPSVIFGAGDRFLNLFARLQRVFPVMPLAGAEARFQPVWVGDVAAALVAALARPQSSGQTYECAGPSTYTLAELVRLSGRWAGCERPVLPLPDVLGRVQAAMMSLLPGEPLMSADNLDSMRVPNVATGWLPELDALGIAPTALEAVAPAYLGPGAGSARMGSWRALARRS